MQQQSTVRSVLILLVVAIIVVGVVVVKSLPKEEAAPARSASDDQSVQERAAASPVDATRYGTREEAPNEPSPEEERTLMASEAGEREASPAPLAPDRPARPERGEPSSEPEPPAEAEPAAPGPAEPEPEEPVEPLPGSKLKSALANGQPTMADFGAGWCQACKKMDLVLKQAAQKYDGTANIVYVDTDEFPQMARDYKVRAIPTQIFFDSSGKEVSRHMGYWPIEEVDKQFAALGVGG